MLAYLHAGRLHHFFCRRSQVGDANAAVPCTPHLAQMREKYDVLIQRAFGGDKLFQNTLNQAFEHFINLNPRSPEYISLFMDDKLRKGLKVRGLLSGKHLRHLAQRDNCLLTRCTEVVYGGPSRDQTCWVRPGPTLSSIWCKPWYSCCLAAGLLSRETRVWVRFAGLGLGNSVELTLCKLGGICF